MTELERALVALGNELEFPPTPDVWARVRERLHRRRWLRPAVFAVALGVVALGIAFAVPPARSAILRFFHIGAATVERVDTLPPAEQRPLVFGLGAPVSRATLTVPPGATALRFYERDGLAAALLRYKGEVLLLAEVRGDQTGFFKKFTDADTRVESVELGDLGVWISGGRHVLLWEFHPNEIHEAETRLAGDVLLWVQDSVTYRLEGNLDKAQMLELARQITR